MSVTASKSVLLTHGVSSGGMGLAPMVRCGTLPLRMQAYMYGASFMYTEEMIAQKLQHCTRTVVRRRVPRAVVEDQGVQEPRTKRPCLHAAAIDMVDWDVVEYSTEGGRVELQCLPRHAGSEFAERTVLQLGAYSVDACVAAARLVADDVGAIDLNMGCPKPFSTHAGMGSALMSAHPESACAMISALVATVGERLPVSAKTRLLESAEATVSMWLALQAAGISWLGVHCRLIKDRPAERCRYDHAAQCLEMARRSGLHVPVILSGDIFEPADGPAALAWTHGSATMAARGALKNPSIFRSPGNGLPLPTVLSHYLTLSVPVAHFKNAKYTLQRMLIENSLLNTSFGRKLTSASNFDDLFASLSLLDEYLSSLSTLHSTNNHKCTTNTELHQDSSSRISSLPSSPPSYWEKHRILHQSQNKSISEL